MRNTNTIRAAVIILGLGLSLAACKSGGGGSQSLGGGPSDPDVPISLTVEVHTGSGFECFILGRGLYCRGVSTNVDLDINSAQFALYAEDSDSNMETILTRDDTLCFTTAVQDRPFGGGSGIATYCIGEASLQGAPGGQPMIYTTPMFSSVSHGSPDLSYSSEPMMAADLPMSTVIAANVLTDGQGSVSVDTENCTLLGPDLTCETFTAGVINE